MSTATATSSALREQGLLGQTVVVIGGSAGIGLETARRASAEGADVILTGRDKERLKQAANQVDARATAAFDATDPASVERFFRDVSAPIDHVLVTAGRPHYIAPLEAGFEEARAAVSEHILQALWVARAARHNMRAPGTLLFMGGVGGRRIARGMAIVSAVTAAMPALPQASRSSSRRSG